MMSCSTEGETEYAPQLPGYYKVTAIQADAGTDLNNDGIKTTDIFFEIAGPHTTVNGKQISYLDFNSPPYYLEIRPLPESGNKAKLISFNFPSQYIDYRSDTTPFLMGYLPSFMNYSYELNQKSNVIQLTNGNPDYDEKGNLKSLKMLPNNELELTLTNQVFDFVETDWFEVNMVVKYEKVK
jgi:hypothetical protein